MSQELDFTSLLEKSEETRQTYDEFARILSNLDQIDAQGLRFYIDNEAGLAIAPNGLEIDFSTLYGISNGTLTDLISYTIPRWILEDLREQNIKGSKQEF
jgi:hypothetical protein